MSISIDSSKLITSLAQLQAAKDAKIATLSQSCRDAIKEGFESDALGEHHFYPSNETDQLNLGSSLTDSLLSDQVEDWTTPFWCANQKGEWAMRSHTAEQIQQVGREAKARILSLIQHNAALAEQVQVAADTAVVHAVVWGHPVIKQ